MAPLLHRAAIITEA